MRAAHVLAVSFVGIVACGGPEPASTPNPATPNTVAATAQTDADDVAPVRVRLFDLLDSGHAALAAQDTPAAAAAETRTLLDGPGDGTDAAPQLWFSTVIDNRPESTDELGDGFALPAEGGVEGGALRLGPGVTRDRSYASLVTAAEPLTRYRVTGRVRLADNPLSGEASAREVLQVFEHDSNVSDPTRIRRRGWGGGPERHRVSRELDPSGWDRFQVEFLSRPTTRTLELRLLHRSGDSEQASTWFDDVQLEQQKVAEPEMYAFLATRYRPRDGQEANTPWRLRVPLLARAPEGQQSGQRREYRDAVLLPPPGELAFPLRLPKAATEPQLRFSYGMLPEAFGLDGDGAVVRARFRPDGGDEVDLGSVTFDPKNERGDREWLDAAFDLSAVAGENGARGTLTLAVTDIDGTEPDILDAVVLSSPRIVPAKQVADGLNLLLIGIDTLRADRMSAFGYEKDTTPRLAALGERSVKFTRCYAQAPWTLPSFSTVFTSLFPSAHGAGRGGHDEWTPIDPTTTALAEVLARVGYLTQGITANHLISPSYGLDQGFAGYRVPASWSMESAQVDTAHVTEFLAENRTAPFFLFWHIMDPHLPYDTDDKFRTAFTDPDYEGRFKGRRGYQVPFQVLDPRPGRRWFTHEGPPPAPEMSDTDRAFVHGYYDAEIAEVDAAIGTVLDALEQHGLAERTVVALVADHGEGLGEHDHYHHGYTLFDDQTHIPMLVHVPGGEAKVIDRPVGSIDLAPTLLGVLGVPIPDAFEGVDRLAADAPTDDAVIMEYPTYDSSAQKAWVLGSLKYLHDPLFHTEHLFDFAADPAERTDLLQAKPDVAKRARAELDAFRWQQLQKGRFHIRLVAKKGQRLRIALRTDDLFDANFVTRPQVDEHHFSMDLGRTELVLDTVLTEGPIELVCWCRGTELSVAIELDGKPLRNGLSLGPDATAVALPTQIEISGIPEFTAAAAGMPRTGEALLWLEAGASQVMPVVPSPEEVEHLKQLGYTK